MKLAILKVDNLNIEHIKNVIRRLRKIGKRNKNPTIIRFLNQVKMEKVIFNIDSIIMHEKMRNFEIAYLLYIFNIPKAEIFTPGGIKPFYNSGYYDEDKELFFSEEELIEPMHFGKQIFLKNIILKLEEISDLIEKRSFFGNYRFELYFIRIHMRKNNIYVVDMVIAGQGTSWKKEIFHIYTKHIGENKVFNPQIYQLGF